MAAKRRAGKQLTQDNWDQEEEPEEVGVFEKAPENVLKNRIIRTAKRRGIGGSNEDGSSKSIFSGFSGFTSSMSNNSSKSFSFLSTAKSSDTNQAGDNKPSSLSFIPNSNNSDTVKSTGDAPNKPFSFLSKSKLPNGTDSEENKFPASFLSKTTNSTSDTNKLSFFTPDKPKNELKDAVSQPKLQELSKQLKKTDDSPSIKNTSSAAVNNDKNSEDIFLRKLKSLNLLCAEWILEHLNENPHCILTPVFDDYKKHLNQLQEERQANNTSSKRAKFEMKVEAEITAPPSTSFKAPNFKESLSKVNFGTSFFTKPLPQSQPELLFGNNETKPAYDFNKNAKSESDNVFKPTSTGMFSFGSNATSPDSKTDKPVESTIPKPTPGFGGALNGAAKQFSEAYDSGLKPMEFVNEMRNKGQLIMGIGHRVKSINNPDMRVKIIKDFVLQTFPATPLLQYALEVESITTSKKPNLILNVDGVIAVAFCDLLRHSGAFTREEAQEYIDMGSINSLFVLGRSIGFIGHYLDQKRLKQGLYRHPWDDISYVLPEQYN